MAEGRAKSSSEHMRARAVLPVPHRGGLGNSASISRRFSLYSLKVFVPFTRDRGCTAGSPGHKKCCNGARGGFVENSYLSPAATHRYLESLWKLRASPFYCQTPAERQRRTWLFKEWYSTHQVQFSRLLKHTLSLHLLGKKKQNKKHWLKRICHLHITIEFFLECAAVDMLYLEKHFSMYSPVLSLQLVLLFDALLECKTFSVPPADWLKLCSTPVHI